MTNRLLKKQQTGMNSHTRRRLIALLCFDFWFDEKSVLSFLCVKYKASINAFFNM